MAVKRSITAKPKKPAKKKTTKTAVFMHSNKAKTLGWSTGSSKPKGRNWKRTGTDNTGQHKITHWRKTK